MPDVTVTWNGMDDYLLYLKHLPADCTTEAEKLIVAGVNSAYVTVATVYGQHQHTGTLLKRLQIFTTPKGRELKSGSPIAWLFDHGSQARRWVGGKSTGRMWGRTPPTFIFTRTAGRTRRALTNAYKAMLLRRGAVSVTGDK